jgi:hypothetical protein
VDTREAMQNGLHEGAAQHRVLLSTECCSAQSAAQHRVLLSTECCSAQSAAQHRVLLSTECCNTGRLMKRPV